MRGAIDKIGLFAGLAIALFDITPPVLAQQDIFGLFGGMVQAAMAQTARQEWATRPGFEIECLGQQGLSVDTLAARGVTPSDPRLRQQLSQCRAQHAAAAIKPVPTAASTPSTAYNSKFRVDGLTLGGAVHPDSKVYQSYACQRSDDFQGFTWCRRRQESQGKNGPQTASLSILHSESGNAFYISKTISPAFFGAGEIDKEIERISQQVGLKPTVLRSKRIGTTQGVIATWGDATLIPLDGNAMDDLRNNRPIHQGLLFDFLNNERRSAREGFQVYAIRGGGGYLWGASFDSDGRGMLRMSVVDMNAISYKPPAIISDNSRSSYAPEPKPLTLEQTVDDQANRERDRALRLEKLLPPARQIVEDASDFIKSDPTNARLLDYIERIAALNSAILSKDLDAIDRQSSNLTTQLNREPAYQKMNAERVQERKRQDAKYLGEAMTLAQKQKRFMLDFVGKNPASPASIKLVPLIKQVDIAMGVPELSRMQSLTSTIDIAVREAGLRDAYNESANLPPASGLKADVAKKTPSTLPTTDKNRFLIEGDLEDVVVLYNASPASPHVSLNLRGDLVFANSRGDVCQFGSATDNVAMTLKTAIASYRLRTIIGANLACEPARLSSYDMIVSRRGAFLGQNLPDALVLVKAIETDVFKQFSVVTSAKFREIADAEQRQIDEITTDVSKGVGDHFGMVFLKSGSQNICMVVSEKAEAHQELLLKSVDKLSYEMHGEPIILKTDLEAAFAESKKRQCGSIYAGTPDLKTITEGLNRDKIEFKFASLWLTKSDLDAADLVAVKRRRDVEEENTKRAQRVADEARLEAQRRSDQQETLTSRRKVLQTKYVGVAKAASASQADDLRSWTTSQSGNAATLYPLYTAWLRERLSDHWEVQTLEADLHDYGTVDFKGRNLEAPFTEIKVRLKNRMLGQYEDRCFLFGRVNDVEFGMVREPFEASCGEGASIQAWKLGHKFESRWNPPG